MISEKTIVGEGTEYPLNGILTLPEDRPGTVPAVVMVHGSGPSNMDEKVMKLTPFKDLAQGLAERGVASIRYDKRTFAHAGKMRKKEITVKEETIDDALLAIDVLRNDDRIDGSRIFVLGHSMGAMLAPRIASEAKDVRGTVLMAGTPFRLEDIVLRQLKQADSANPLLKWIFRMQRGKYSKLFDGLYDLSDAQARKKKFAGSMNLYYFKEMGLKTAADYLLEDDRPALILQGEKDFQVLAEEDYKAFRELLKNRENTWFRLYPDLNHCFVEAIYDDILKASKEYGTERHIGNDVMDDIAEFVSNR